MYTNREIKEEEPFSDVVSLTETLFTKNAIMKTNNNTVLQDNNCYMTIKTEIKSETPFTSQKERDCFAKHQTVSCSSNCEIDITSGSSSLNVRGFLPKDPIIKVKAYNSDHEIDNKVGIKEEPWWLESQTSLLCDDIKNGDFAPVNWTRLFKEAASGDCGISPLPSTETLVKNTSIKYAKDCQSYVNETSNLKKHLHSEQSDKCNNGEKMYSKALVINKGKKSHKCKICNKGFSHLSHLKEHNLIHEGKKLRKCEVCEKSFTQLSTLKRHYLIHMGKKPHKCKICDKGFTQLSDLKKHILIHEDNKPHRCIICEKSFRQLSTLKRHNLIHEGKRHHKCEICEKSFTQLSTLKRHYFIHKGKKPHKCDICDNSFTQLSDLKNHILIHEGNKPHKCKICKKNFRLLSTLKRHNLMHDSEKTHKCEICEKSFTHLSYLKEHKLMHEDKKPHKCRSFR